MVSYLLKGDIEVQTRFLSEIESGHYYAIAPLVYYEVKRGLLYIEAKTKLREFNKLCENSVRGDMDYAVWEQAILLYIALRRKGITVEDADLFIAAYCLKNDYVLVTNNMRHFEAFDDLQLANWK
jgi:predicted nucleic acid-binding protein